MSGKSDTIGLHPKWTQQMIKLEYKEPSSLINITLRGQHQNETAICSATVEVSTFLNKNKTIATVPLYSDDEIVGEVKFELIG